MPRSAKPTTSRLLDRLRDQVGGAADAHQVGAPVLPDRLDRRRPALGLADHGDEAGLGEHHLGELVHPRRRRRAGRADDLVAHRIDRADVVDDAVGEVHRQRLALGEHVLDPLVRGVAAGQHLAAQEQRLARLPARDLVLASACRGRPSSTCCSRAPSARRARGRGSADRGRPGPSRRGRSGHGASRRSSGSSPPACSPRASAPSRS